MPLADAREPVDHALEWRSYSPSAVKIKLASESNAVIAEALSTTDEAAPPHAAPRRPDAARRSLQNSILFACGRLFR